MGEQHGTQYSKDRTRNWICSSDGKSVFGSCMCQVDMRDSVFTSVPARMGLEVFDHRCDSAPSVEIDNVELLSRKSQFGSLKWVMKSSSISSGTSGSDCRRRRWAMSDVTLAEIVTESVVLEGSSMKSTVRSNGKG